MEKAKIISNLPAKGIIKCIDCKNEIEMIHCPKCNDERRYSLILYERDNHYLNLGMLIEDLIRDNKIIIQANGRNITKMECLLRPFIKFGMEIKRSIDKSQIDKHGRNIIVERAEIIYDGTRRNNQRK